MEIQYKQFRAKIYFSAETDSFYGEVLDIPWLVSFQARDVQEARCLMQEAIECYLSYRETSMSSDTFFRRLVRDIDSRDGESINTGMHVPDRHSETLA